MKKWWEENWWKILLSTIAIVCFVMGLLIGTNLKKCPTCPPTTERVYVGYQIGKNDTLNIVIDSIITKVEFRPSLKGYYHPEFETLKYPIGGKVQRDYYYDIEKDKIILSEIRIFYERFPLIEGGWSKNNDDSVWYPAK